MCISYNPVEVFALRTIINELLCLSHQKECHLVEQQNYYT